MPEQARPDTTERARRRDRARFDYVFAIGLLAFVAVGGPIGLLTVGPDADGAAWLAAVTALAVWRLMDADRIMREGR